MRRQLQKILLFFETAADYGICLYILAVLVILPFYFTEGFSYIGTDKALFFRGLNSNLGRILLPLAAFVLLLKLLEEAVNFFCRMKAAGRTGQGERGQAERKILSVIQKRLSLTDLFAALYGIALILSYTQSDYKETSFLGVHGWFMGFVTQMAFVLIYFLVSRLWKPRKWMVYLVLPVSAVVFFLGYLDRFGLHILEMQSRSAAYISTIGNINWYCGYAVTVFFLGVILLWREEKLKNWQRYLLMAYIVLGFAALLTQGSESGTLTVGVVLLVMFCLSAKNGRQMQLFWQEMTLMSAGCLVSAILRWAVGEKFELMEGVTLKAATSGPLPIIMTMVSTLMWLWIRDRVKKEQYPKKLFQMLAKGLIAVCIGAVALILLLAAVNTAYPGSLGVLSEHSLFTFSRNWGSNRGATWAAAVMCFQEQDLLHKLVGVGPDAMSAYFLNGAGEALQIFLKECFGGSVLTNAHNEWLTILADIGIFGIISYAGIMVSAMFRFFRAGRKNTLLCAIGFCLLAYTVNNFVSFQQTLNGATVFVLLGIGEALHRKAFKS